MPSKTETLTPRFEASRAHLRGVAYRILGSLHEADDAVQEAYLRLVRLDTRTVENWDGYATTVTARICLDVLRARKARGETFLPAHAPNRAAATENDPETEALLADAIGHALLVVLQTLSPAERIAFVLHDLFDVPFDAIAPIIERSTVATRQLASRARRRVKGTPAIPAPEITRQREVVAAFLAASRGGNFETLLGLLDPNVVLRADAIAVQAGGQETVTGASAVARHFAGRAQAARPALINGFVAIVVAPGGRLFLALLPQIVNGKITSVEVIGDPARLHQLDFAVLA